MQIQEPMIDRGLSLFVNDDADVAADQFLSTAEAPEFQLVKWYCVNSNGDSVRCLDVCLVRCFCRHTWHFINLLIIIIIVR